MVVAFLPFLSAPAQAVIDVGGPEMSQHAHLSHEMSGHNIHNGHHQDRHGAAQGMTDHEACCDTSDICTHEHCTMNSFQVFGLLKSAEAGIVYALRMPWNHDIMAQRDGHRPLLDPPIP